MKENKSYRLTEVSLSRDWQFFCFILFSSSIGLTLTFVCLLFINQKLADKLIIVIKVDHYSTRSTVQLFEWTSKLTQRLIKSYPLLSLPYSHNIYSEFSLIYCVNITEIKPTPMYMVCVYNLHVTTESQDENLVSCE